MTLYRLVPAFILAITALSLAFVPRSDTRPADAGPTILQVDRTDDLAAAAGCTPAPNDCSLRGAVINSNSDDEAEKIALPAGEYDLTTPGADEDAAQTGDLDIRSNVTIEGDGASITTIKGNQLDRVFDNQERLDGQRQLVIDGVTITGGLIGQGGGAAIRNRYETLVLDDTVIMGNSAPYAGAIENLAGATTISRTTIIKNNASGIGVGAIYNNSGQLTITQSTFSSNSGADGGAIANAGGTLTVTNSTFSGNDSTFGGAIVTNGDATLTSVTIAGNAVTPEVLSPSADVRPQGGSIGGGGLTSYAPFGHVSIKNTIIANNSDGTGNANHDCAGAISSLGYNLIETLSAGCDITGVSTGNITGQDPMLGLLQNNGGQSHTHALLPGSPALNAGSPDCPPPAVDQRTVSRPQGNACDIGAYEAEGPFPLRQGDVDCDGDVDNDDAIYLMEVEADLEGGEQTAPCPDIDEDEPTSGFPWGDLNCDNAVNAKDVLYLLAFRAGIFLPKPGNCFTIGQVIT